MSTHMDNIRRMAELEAERDAALEQVIYWRERAVGAEAERDALTAHVERLRESIMPGSHDSVGERLLAVGRALAQSPTTSLARLKAEWQADAVSEFASRYLGGHEQELAEIYAGKLRRQAEGGEQ
ncbi:hypothetical protein [uncultured Halomonas sp.]|uniref:hypothetical protein n=1 Tax=uncultured Halomonas sp. TaxID=173971 RepID=UPI00261537AB|nr:hypothetical protein [uncultured Halomonas sp.]